MAVDFNEFPHLFSPIDVGPVHLKNRLQFSPMVSGHAERVVERHTEVQKHRRVKGLDELAGGMSLGKDLPRVAHGAVRGLDGCLADVGHERVVVHQVVDERLGHKGDGPR